MYCVDKKGYLVAVDNDGTIMSIQKLDKQIDAVLNDNNYLYVGTLLRNSKKDNLDVTCDIYKFDFNNSKIGEGTLVYSTNAFIEEFEFDYDKSTISIVFDKANSITNGRIYELAIFSAVDFSIIDCIDISKILQENNASVLFRKCALWYKEHIFAIILDDEVIVWDFVFKEVVFRKKVEDATDGIWIDRSTLLITTYEGLYELKFK